MRALALVLAFLALAGCKSGRDYTSLNRTSEHFLFDTFHDGNHLRKQNLKQDLAFSQRAPKNKMIRKTSRKFAWQSFWMDEGKGFSEIKRGLEAERVPMSQRLASMRFGFLDSGD